MKLSAHLDLSPERAELVRLAEAIADVLTGWGGKVWNIGYDLTAEAADFSLDAPDGTALTVIVRRGRPYVEDCHGNIG